MLHTLNLLIEANVDGQLIGGRHHVAITLPELRADQDLQRDVLRLEGALAATQREMGVLDRQLYEARRPPWWRKLLGRR
jgi:hypothetical protein